MGQTPLFRNVGNKLPLMPKMRMNCTDTLSTVISNILTVSANIIWRCDRYFVPKLREGTTTKSQKDPWIWERLFRNVGM